MAIETVIIDASERRDMTGEQTTSWAKASLTSDDTEPQRERDYASPPR
jgi:hypothetical protein